MVRRHCAGDDPDAVSFFCCPERTGYQNNADNEQNVKINEHMIFFLVGGLTYDEHCSKIFNKERMFELGRLNEML